MEAVQVGPKYWRTANDDARKAEYGFGQFMCLSFCLRSIITESGNMTVF